MEEIAHKSLDSHNIRVISKQFEEVVVLNQTKMPLEESLIDNDVNLPWVFEKKRKTASPLSSSAEVEHKKTKKQGRAPIRRPSDEILAQMFQKVDCKCHLMVPADWDDGLSDDLLMLPGTAPKVKFPPPRIPIEGLWNYGASPVRRPKTPPDSSTTSSRSNSTTEDDRGLQTGLLMPHARQV